MQTSYPQSILSDERAWGVWRLAYMEDEVQKQLVSLTGRAPNVNDPNTWVDYATAVKARDTQLSRPADPHVTLFLRDNPKATQSGLIWLIQPGFIALDYDGLAENPELHSLYKANPTWTERSSRGDGVHQIFSHPSKPRGVIKDILKGIDARASGTMLFTTGRANPDWPEVQPLTEFFEDAISTKSRATADARQSVRSRHACAEDNPTDEELLTNFSADAEALLYAQNDKQALNSEVLGLFVKRLSRYTADFDQMLRVFCAFPCAQDENITAAKRRRKVTDVCTLFTLHYDNMLKNGTLEPPMLTFNLQLGQETVTSISPPTVKPPTVFASLPPPFPPNMQVLATALDAVSAVCDDVAPPSVIQLTRLMAGDRLLTEAVYLTPELKLKTTLLDTRPLIHFFMMANSGRGKSRSFRRIKGFVNHMIQAGFLLSPSPVRDLGKGVQGANKLALNIASFEKHAAEIGLTDEADANFNVTTDPGGAKAFLKEFTENVCAPGALTVADKTVSGKRIELQDYVVQLSFLSTIKAMKPLLARHLGDGLLARLVLWVSTEPAVDVRQWDGTVEGKSEKEQLDLADAAVLVQRYLSAPPVTVTYPSDLLYNNVGLTRRLLGLGVPSENSIDEGDEEDAFNRYVTYAQYLSAIYAWSECPEQPVHTVESLEWGVSFLEFAKGRVNALFASIAHTVDETTYQAKHANNVQVTSNQYEAAVLSFYTEGADLDKLKELLSKKRVTAGTLAKLQERVLTAGMINQYSAAFFGLKAKLTSTQFRDSALQDLAKQGLVELRSAAGIPLDATHSLKHDTEIHLVKAYNDE